MMPKLIAFGHRRRTGKDWAAKCLAQQLFQLKKQQLAVRIIGFADELKVVCEHLYGWAGLRDRIYYEIFSQEKEVILPALGKSPRQIWLDFGTRAVRNCVYEHTWCDWLMHNLPEVEYILITDLRFPDEFAAVKERGGICIKMERPDLPDSDDPADNALAAETRWDYVITARSGELEKITEQLEGVLKAITQG